jgi:hypothetical protein
MLLISLIYFFYRKTKLRCIVGYFLFVFFIFLENRFCLVIKFGVSVKSSEIVCDD